MLDGKLTDRQWRQIASIVQAGIPIESIAEMSGVKIYEVFSHLRAIPADQLEPYNEINEIPGASSPESMQANWLTAVELNLLGVNLVGRGVKIAGHIGLPCEPTIDVGQDNNIQVRSVKKHHLYAVPVSVIMRLWELRPEPKHIAIRCGDSPIVERLIRKVIALSINQSQWSEVNVEEHISALMEKRSSITSRDERIRQRAAVLRIENGEIQEYVTEVV
jgi:hypothetical protein